MLVGCISKPDRISAIDDGGTSDGGLDATGDCDAVKCGMKFGECEGAVCVIRRSTEGKVDCPDGGRCRVECIGTDACKLGGVDCKRSTGCEVVCMGDNACQYGGVNCGESATCNVHCEGGNACQLGNGDEVSVECQRSDCEVTCEGSSSTCQEGIRVMPGGMCNSHCCDGGCGSGVCSMNDTTCS